jgi:hypothetical protein
MKNPLVIVALLAIGISAVILGELDNSPGLQVLGALFAIAAVALGIRTVQRST